MATISDEYVRQMLQKSRLYSLVILRATAKRKDPEALTIVIEHGMIPE